MIIDIYTLIESKLNLYIALFTTQVFKCFTARRKVPEGDRPNIKHGQISMSEQIRVGVRKLCGSSEN